MREEVAALLWPDEPDRSARRLSVLLSTIRSVLDPDKTMPPDHYVAADHDTVWLVREHVEVDVELFLARRRRRPPAARRRRRRGGRAGAVTGGRPVPRRVLRRRPVRRLGRRHCASWPATRSSSWPVELARLADGRAEHGDAVRHRLRILDVDPYDEDAHLDLIRSLTAQRRHGEARRAYRTYCARLAELELEPAPFP